MKTSRIFQTESKLFGYIRSRSKELRLSLSEVILRTGVSRQTVYSLRTLSKHLPSLELVVRLAEVLRVHPLQLLHLIFDEVPIDEKIARRYLRSDQSGFVRDITFPDGSLVFPGERFVKSWEIQNIGNVPWENRFLICIDEEIIVATRSGETVNIAHSLIPTVKRVPVPFTAPGEMTVVSVEFTAPDSPGTVLSYWKSVFADGSLCFPNSSGLWVKVRVSTATVGAFEDRTLDSPSVQSRSMF